jgi:hypothetical protein
MHHVAALKRLPAVLRAVMKRLTMRTQRLMRHEKYGAGIKGSRNQKAHNAATVAATSRGHP